MTEGTQGEFERALSGKVLAEHILKRLDFEWPEESRPSRASGSFYYVGLRDGKPMVQAFCKNLKRSLVDFCLPMAEVKKAKKQYDETGDEDVFYELQDKARDLYMRARNETKRSGEGGELILFLLLEQIGAPQVVSKMALKTASDMPVHGSDGLHIGPSDAEGCDLVFYIGESKLHHSYDGALADALSSVVTLSTDAKKSEREIQLVTDNLDKSGFDEGFLSKLEEYLDPYSAQYIKRKDVHACLVGFDCVNYDEISAENPEDAEERLVRELKDLASSKLGNLSKRLEKEKYNKIDFCFFFLPLPSVEEFREMFNRVVLRMEVDA